MKAILTKYLPFTNTKPSRIKASAEGVPSIIYSDYALASENNHADPDHVKVAKRFAQSNNWSINLASGGLPSGDWAHCFVTDTNQVHAVSPTEGENGIYI